MASDLRQLKSLLIAAVVSLLVVSLHGQDDVTDNSMPVPHAGGTFMMTLWNTYNGKPMVRGSQVPVQFELTHKDPTMLRISFNTSTERDTATSKNYTPEAFGMMFLGEKDRYVAFEVEKSDKSQVHIYDGFNNILTPKQELKVSYKPLVSNNDSWNGLIMIPLDYFPRAVSKMACYANYTEHPGDKKYVLSLQTKNSEMDEQMPNLQKIDYFQDVMLSKQMPDLIFDKYSMLWQDNLHITSGGSSMENVTESSSDHQAHTGTGNNTATSIAPLFTLVSFSAVMLLHP